MSTNLESKARALFVGHGSPMNAIQKHNFTETWREIGERVGAPKAIITVCAHWYTHGTYVTAMEDPKSIHDFWGFPPALSEVQ